jgi:hypothetical protein
MVRVAIFLDSDMPDISLSTTHLSSSLSPHTAETDNEIVGRQTTSDENNRNIVEQRLVKAMIVLASELRDVDKNQWDLLETEIRRSVDSCTMIKIFDSLNE